MATHSSILVWRFLWRGEPDRLQSMGSQRVRHNWTTEFFHFTFSLSHDTEQILWMAVQHHYISQGDYDVTTNLFAACYKRCRTLDLIFLSCNPTHYTRAFIWPIDAHGFERQEESVILWWHMVSLSIKKSYSDAVSVTVYAWYLWSGNRYALCHPFWGWDFSVRDFKDAECMSLVLTQNNVSSVQSISRVQLFAIPWITARQASLSITNSQGSPKPTPIELVMPFNHPIFCRPLLLLPSIFPSIRVFSNESALHIRWPQYWSFSFNISPSNEHPGLISFKIDWLDLLAVQGTLKSLLQHHSSKASILWHYILWTIVQLSHPYMTTGKTIALTRQTFVGKVMSLLFNMLSRLVITCLPRSKRLLISWLQSPSAVILEPRKIKSATVSTVSPSICHEVMGLDAMIFVFFLHLFLLLLLAM